ncbi:MAG TPA: hypothetical protein VNK95_11280, partial [Caldilineaceae bacterium]|nr:hypothetical protein [Caldilineaceae bacterium]
GWLYRAELRAAGLFAPQSLGWFAVAALLGGTMGLARLDALPLAGTSLGLWLAHLGGDTYPAGSSSEALRDAVGIGQYGLLWPWLRLAVDQPFLLLAGLAGLWLTLRRQRADRRWQLLLAVWLCAALLLWLLPGRSPYLLPIAGFPLMLFAAGFVQELVRRAPQDMPWREALAVVATLTILVISGSFWGTALASSRVYDPVMAQATGVIFALALGIIVAYAFWSNRRHALWLTAAFVAVMAGLLVIRSGWQLNQVNGPLYLSGFFSRFTHPEVRLLVEDIETLSAIRTGNPHELPVQVQVASQTVGSLTLAARPDPVLGWYLRAMRELVWAPAPSVSEPGDETAPQPLAVTLIGAGSAIVAEPAGDNSDEAPMRYNLPEEYAGSVYHVEAWWLPEMLVPPEANTERPEAGGFAAAWTEWVQPALRWLIYRRAPALPPTRDVALWAPLGG